jgi:hypothetical protein
MFGQRTFVGTGASAEGDKIYAQYIYNDVSGSLSYGQPLYVDVRDAAEFDNKNTNTALSPAAAATGGKVVLGTTAAGVGTNPVCVGVFQPENPGSLPNNGDVVRVLVMGRGIVSAQSPAAGAAGNVGARLIVSTAVADAVPGAAAVALTIGVILATKTFLANGNTIFAAASATRTLVNAFVMLQ